jgi:hypothetical protein
MARVLCIGLLGLMVVGCATQRLYAGSVKPTSELAIIEGAPLFTAGLPFRVVLRKIDDTKVRFGYSKAAVEPGKHVLLVDCVIAEPYSISRFELAGDFDAGGHYVLSATIRPGNKACESVDLRAQR